MIAYTHKTILSDFTFFKQEDKRDCGPACLYMISCFYDIACDITEIRNYCNISANGVTLDNLCRSANIIGYATNAVLIDLNKLCSVPLPCILHFRCHYVILYRIENDIFYILDPACGFINYSTEIFVQFWFLGNYKGIALLLLPNEQ